MLEKNKEYIGVVSRLGVNGEGIIIDNEFVVFVPFALVGEKVKYKILKVQKRFAYAKLVEVYTEADERVRPICPVFTKCGGCQLQHLKYSSQLKFKSEIVIDCFSKISGIKMPKPKITKSEEYNYRNKLQIPVQQTDKGVVMGFYANNSHRVVEIDDCPINQTWAKKIISIFKNFLKEYNVEGYNEQTKKGLVKHLLVRCVNNHYLITVVINSKSFHLKNELIKAFESQLTSFSLYLNINLLHNNVITTDEFILIHGKPFERYEYKGIVANIDAKSFMQVNKTVSEKLYSKVASLIEPNSVVIDAYSGAGLMTGIIAKTAKKVYGIESVKEAVDCANILKEENNLQSKMENIVGNCEEVLPNLIDKIAEPITVVLDPPRKGCDIKVIKAIKDAKPEKLIYVSCNSATLARDIGVFLDLLKEENGQLKKEDILLNFDGGEVINNYKLTHFEIYDMFSQTKHLENLICLTKVN